MTSNNFAVDAAYRCRRHARSEFASLNDLRNLSHDAVLDHAQTMLDCVTELHGIIVGLASAINPVANYEMIAERSDSTL